MIGNRFSGIKAQFHKSNGIVWVCRMPEKLLFLECILPTVKVSGGGIVAFRPFLSYGLGPLIPILDMLNAGSDNSILNNTALLTLWHYCGSFLSEVPSQSASSALDRVIKCRGPSSIWGRGSLVAIVISLWITCSSPRATEA
ncbi:hypothetical protein TNCV_998141 [Trichonephila clavipes]|nr:hypothetical protein TNCV_998141 [Trichonephila clavipes]